MLSRLPRRLYSPAQTRELDRIAIQDCGIPGYQLMCRAGRAAFDLLSLRWPAARRVLVVCGSGNNGGDGFVIARLLVRAGREVQLLLLGEHEWLGGDARRAYEDFRAAGGRLIAAQDIDWQRAEVVVDALFGSGLARPVQGMAAQLIREINGCAAPVLAVDVPSGLDADTGSALGIAVAAQATLTFIGCKRGLLTHQGPDHCGALFFDDLDVPAEIYTALDGAVERVDADSFPELWRARCCASHKGSYGHVAVVGGAPGMLGAAQMAAAAAMRVGAGRTTVITGRVNAPLVNSDMHELMSRAADDATVASEALRGIDVVAVGPGLGQGGWSESMLAAALASEKPLVIDADALNLVARSNDLRLDNAIATPHPAEAARLLGADTGVVQADRFAAVRALQQSYGGVWVLKGNGTLICDAEQCLLVDAGNPGMASAGMGDLLTGTVVGLLAQGLPPLVAAAGGAWLHASAADRAAHSGMAGLLATDLLSELRRLRGPESVGCGCGAC